jgi:hypothetical protein
MNDERSERTIRNPISGLGTVQSSFDLATAYSLEFPPQLLSYLYAAHPFQKTREPVSDSRLFDCIPVTYELPDPNRPRMAVY